MPVLTMPTDWAREFDRRAQERIAEAGFAQARAIENASKRDYAAGYRDGFEAGRRSLTETKQ